MSLEINIAILITLVIIGLVFVLKDRGGKDE